MISKVLTIAIPKTVVFVAAALLLVSGMVRADRVIGRKEITAPVVVRPTVTPVISVTTTSIAVPTLSQIDTKNWKKYKNEVYGYEIRFPENFGMMQAEGITKYGAYQTVWELSTGYQMFNIVVDFGKAQQCPSVSECIEFLKKGG